MTVREVLVGALSGVTDVSRIGRVGLGDLLSCYTARPADVILIGARREVLGAVPAIRRLVSVHPAANVIVFGAPEDTSSIAAAIAAGARGFLRWDVSRPALVTTLTRALGATSAPERPRPGLGSQLSERELQVLRGMSEGHSNSQIGSALFLAEDTVKSHARRLFRKLEVSDRAEAVAHGFRLGLVS